MIRESEMLYFAYGSNLNHASMRRRCPAARPVAPLVLPHAVLRFRHVADVASHEAAKCPGGLWRITTACEAALDVYEGVASGLYEKRYLLLRVDGAEEECLYYKMASRGIMPPAQGYLAVIEQGYRDFGLDLSRLERAVEHSWNRRYKTPELRRRYARRGRPALAQVVA
jgi:hypothetical protein